MNIDSSPPRSVQPVQSTNKQGEEGFAHGIWVPSTLVGRPGASGELKAQHTFFDSCFTTVKTEDETKAFSIYYKSYKCMYCGNLGRTVDRCWIKQKNEGQEADAVTMAVDTGQIMSSGGSIMMIPTATIE